MAPAHVPLARILRQPDRLEELVFNPEHSLDRAEPQRAVTTHLTNADGFGLGWYGTADGPGRYRSVSPAWSDRNLQELCAQIRSPLFIAHVRAATGTPVQQTNCHPFRHGRWLFVHNGFIDEYPRLRRELMLAVDPDLFTNIEGTTDSELMFHLALTFGLDSEPLAASGADGGFVEETGRRHGVAEPLQMTVGVTDGERLYAAATRATRRPTRCSSRTDVEDDARALSGRRTAQASLRRSARRRVRAAG